MFEEYLNKTGEYGTITAIEYPLITVRGLPHAHPNEMLIFENGYIGQVYDIDKSIIHALIFSQKSVELHSRVTRTNITMSVPVNDDLLGNIVDPLGNIIGYVSPQHTHKKTVLRQVYAEAPGISKRTPIKKPLLTGVTKIDLLIPLGKGQRELIIGDVKTGKTMFLLRTIVNQIKYENTFVIYAAIAKKKTEIMTLAQFFKDENVKDKTIIVATQAADIASSVFLTPYTAMTIGEYFVEQGHDVLVVFDDLTNHAQRYREIALKSRRFPGRESYPGDIFYTHASLLERAGNYVHPEKGSISLTCLPVAMTTEGDITGYISTNIMSMTDGHIFFDSDIYNRGERPAVNIPLSVTRVGRQTQNALAQEVTRTILSSIAEYEKIKNIAYLGSELSEVSKFILKRGESLMNLLHQDLAVSLPHEVQMLLFGLVWLDKIDLSKEKSYEQFLPGLMKLYENNNLLTLMKDLLEKPTLKEFLQGLGTQEQLLSLCKIEKK